ncbi:MAG: thioesterase family protein [Actinomycetota bacterium]|nr:thioesterase family protein [Actinomycetota bacterium]
MSSAAREDHPFDRDTAAIALGSHRYRVEVSDRWGLLGPGGGFANGGYALALCLRALRAESPHPDPVVVSATYLSRVRFGPAVVEVEPVRHGRRLWAAQARLVQEGKERVRVVASFADLAGATGRTEVRESAPSLPPPHECRALATRSSVPGLTLADRIEFRYVELPGWRRGEPAGVLSDQFWMRFAPDEHGHERDADTIALAALVDMATPPVIDLGEAGSTTIELTVHVRAIPARGWLACRASTRYVMQGFHDEDFEIWDSSGQLVAQSRQLALLPTRR